MVPACGRPCHSNAKKPSPGSSPCVNAFAPTEAMPSAGPPDVPDLVLGPDQDVVFPATAHRPRRRVLAAWSPRGRRRLAVSMTAAVLVIGGAAGLRAALS